MGGGPQAKRCGRDGAKRKSVRKSCRSTGDPAWKTMRQHREDAAGWGAVTELLLAGALQRIAIGKLLLAGRCGEGAERLGALWQRSIGKKLLAWGATKCGKEGGALRWGPCAWGTLRWGRWAGAESLKLPVGNPARGNSCWVTSAGGLCVGTRAG